MNPTLMTNPDQADDEVMARLRAARPDLSEELTSPTGATALALRQEILMTSQDPSGATPSPTEAIAPRRSRRRTLSLAAAGIAAATIGVTLIATGGPAEERDAAVAIPTTSPAPEPVDVQLIAARSGEALARSGRAVVKFATDLDGSQYISSAGTSTIAFAGDDIEMTIVFDGSTPDSPERGSFTSQNKTVGGEFFLLDGPVGDKKWIHDTNAGGGRASELFSIDPRTLFGLLSPDAGFELVGTETMDGIAVRHLRATTVAALDSANFGLGPVEDSTVTHLDIWVGDDDVTRGVDIELNRSVETVDPATAPLLEKRADGTIVMTYPDGRVVERTNGAIDDDLPKITRQERSSYSVRFSDIGAPITIEPPAEYTDVAGVG